MIESIKVDNSVISFMVNKYNLGQKVLVGDCKEVGYIIGIQSGRYGWSYYIVEGEKPNNESCESWYCEDEIMI